MRFKRNLYVMCIIIFLQNLMFYFSVGTLFRQSRGLSMYQIYIIDSLLLILMVIMEVPWGYFADKIGYKKTLVISYFVFMLSKIVMYKANSFSIFLIEGILVAISISGISGCNSALIYTSVGEKESEKAFSIYSASGTAGFFTASLLSTFILQKSMDFAVYLTIFPYIAICICTLFLKDIEHKKGEEIKIFKSLKSVLNNKHMLILLIAICLMNEVWSSIIRLLNQPLYVKCGIPIKYFGLIAAFMAIISMVTAKAYKFSEKFGQKNLLISLYFLIAISVLGLVYIQNAYILLFFIALIEGAYAICSPLQSDIQNKSITTADRATMLSIYSMVMSLGGALVNFLVGKTSNISIETGVLSCSILAMIAFGLLIVFYSNSKKASVAKTDKCVEL